MFTEDYILRQISLLVAVLAKIAGLKKAGKYQEAQKIIDQAIEGVFGLEAGIIKQLDDHSLTSLLTSAYGIDMGKLYFLAGLFEAEGDLLAAQQRKKEGQQSHQRALDLLLAISASPASNLEADISSKINALQKKLDIQD